MTNFSKDQSDFTEDLAVTLLNECGINARRNNLTNISAVDIVIDNIIKADVQLSANFARYNDFRMDIISAFSPRVVIPYSDYNYDDKISFIENFAHKYNCTIQRAGKVAHPNYLDCLIILFYEYQYAPKLPDKVLIVNKGSLDDYLHLFAKQLFNFIKINNKYKANDPWGSAFLPIHVEDIVKWHIRTCKPYFYGTPACMKGQSRKIYAALAGLQQ